MTQHEFRASPNSGGDPRDHKCVVCEQNYQSHLRPSLKELKRALDFSVGLQSHYAKILNEYDGGGRKTFADGKEWIARLKETGNL